MPGVWPALRLGSADEPETFEKIGITSQAERCRFCSQVRRYLRGDYFPEDN